jgi:parvulin-like peptidyl-prolyl isomerase
MFRNISYLIMAATLVLFVACNEEAGGSGAAKAGKPGDDSPVLAVVNGEGITLNDFKMEASKLNPATVQLLADEENRRMLLDKMIDRRLLVQAGNERKLDRDPRVVAHVNRVRDDKVMSLFMKEEIFDKSKVTDSEVREYFDKNLDGLGQVRLSHILVESADTADEVIGKVKNGEAFSTLAKKYSKDAETNGKGGDIGFLSWAELSYSPQLRDEAFSLEPGSLSGVVYTPYGYHVLKVTDRKPAAAGDFDVIKEPLTIYLSTQKADKQFESTVGSLKASA